MHILTHLNFLKLTDLVVYGRKLNNVLHSFNAIIKELISREPKEAPTFWLNPEIKDFYQFTRNDVRVDGYETGEQIKDIPVAI